MKRIALLGSLLFVQSCAGHAEESAAKPSTESRPEPDKPVSLPPFEFAFSNLVGHPDEGPPRPGSAFVKISKNDPVAGQVEWSKIHVEGQRIGWTSENGTETSIHVVFSNHLRKTVPVDFNSGATLVSITVDKLVRCSIKKCSVILWPDSPRCRGSKEEEEVLRVNEVRYRYASGPEQVWQKRTGVVPEDDLCVEHGGKRKIRQWTEAEAKEAREVESKRLLLEADYDWGSRNPKVRRQAKETYGKLLKQFSEESVVRINLDRIKSRAGADIED